MMKIDRIRVEQRKEISNESQLDENQDQEQFQAKLFKGIKTLKKLSIS
jgi:hypothetical protein